MGRILNFLIVLEEGGFSFVVDHEQVWGSSLSEGLRDLLKFKFVRVVVLFLVAHEVPADEDILVIVIDVVFGLF